MIRADLHIHSAHSSDGELSVQEIVEGCLAQGVNLFSLTDHNCAKGNLKAAEAAHRTGIDFISGIEIDCNFEGTDLHVLGYGIDHESKDFVALQEDIRHKVLDSFSQMIDNIRHQGFVIDPEDVLKQAGDMLPTGELIAEVMLSDPKYHSPALAPYINGGTRSDMPYINFYLDFFAQGKPAFVPIEYMSFRQALQLVRDNAGIPIVAHAGLNFRGKESIAERLLDEGAMGLEVFNNYHSQQQTNYFAELAIVRKALMTCGSDFHGKTKPRIEVGQYGDTALFDSYLNNSLVQLQSAFD